MSISIKYKTMWMVLLIIIFMRPSPVDLMGGLGVKVFDLAIFFYAALIIFLARRQLDFGWMKSAPVIILFLICISELISYFVGQFYHTVILEDALEFTRWITYMPLIAAGYLAAKLFGEEFLKLYITPLILMAVFSLLLFTNVADFKAMFSSLYDLEKSRGLENISSAVGLWRLASTFSNPNYFGIFSAISACMLISNIFVERRINTTIFLLLLSMLFFVVVSGSRTSLIAVLFAVTVLFGLSFKGLFAASPRLATTGIVVSALTMPILFVEGYDYLTEKLWRFSNIDNMYESMSGRSDAWGSAWAVIKNDGILIVLGYGSNKEVFQSLDNNYITFMFKNGIFGLLLFVCLILAVLWGAAKNLTRKEKQSRFVGLTVFSATVAMSLSSLTSIPFHHAQLAMSYFFLVGANSFIYERNR